MDINDLKALIASDESRTLELKKSTGELKDGMHAACAFLNTEGSWLIFGITPSSLKIIGQEVTDNTQREIAQALSGLEPAVDVRPDYIDVPDRPGYKVIVMHFEGWVWGKRPHTFHGCPYYKVESTTKVMPQQMYDERIRVHQLQRYSWEDLPAPEISIEDLNEKHIQGCIRNGVEGGRIPGSALSAPISDTLSKWNLLRNSILTNGAVMLFSNNIKGFPNFRMRMARFIGTDKNEFLDNQQAEGNFFDLLDAGLAFCFKHLNLSSRITNHSVYREDRLEIPYKALRETLINSLCHRQWEQRNLTNSIAIYDDRVEIGNPGVFPPQITPENIKLPHDSYPYNLNMATALFRSMLLENWGSGARRIIEACQEQGVEEPTWRWDGGFVYVIFKRPKMGLHDAGMEHNNPEMGHNNPEMGHNNPEMGHNNPEMGHKNKLLKLVNARESLSDKQKLVLEYLITNPDTSLKSCSEAIGVSVKSIRYTIKKVESWLKIQYIGSKKYGKWIFEILTSEDL